MLDPISPRARRILRFLAGLDSATREQIANAIGESRATAIRELRQLVDAGHIAKAGEARATTYSLTGASRSIALWDVDEYLAVEPDRRARYRHLQPDVFQAIRGSIRGLDPLLIQAVERRHRLGDSATARKEWERFVIELSWKSSKIEGNTYTLLDTERLIREAAEAPGHDHAEAVMILNHKRAFEYIWKHQVAFRRLTRSAVDEIHELLTQELGVPRGLRSGPVGITGTAYIPPSSRVEIASHLDAILKAINDCTEPAEKALGCLMLIPYLQPFADGNKRTSRLLANAVLLAYGYPPLSYRSIDEQAYKGALLLFYEQGTVANFRELFLAQLREAALTYFFPVDEAA